MIGMGLMGTIGMQVLEAQRVLPPHARSRNPTRLSVQAEVRDRPECVVLLHGMARTPRCMKKMSRFLDEAGYLGVGLGLGRAWAPQPACGAHLC